MLSRIKTLQIIAVSTASALIVTGLASVAQSESQRETTSSTVIYFDGVTVAGGPGITGTRSITPSPGEHAIEVTPVDTGDPAAMAAAYQAAGRSPVDDAIAAGVSPAMVAKMEASMAAIESGAGAGIVYESFCAYDNQVYMDGEACVIRSYDNTEVISGYGIRMDQTQALGNESSPYFWDELHLLGAKNQYARAKPDLTIVAKNPASDVTGVTSCRDISVSASYGSFGASIGGQICPDMWDASVSSGTTYPQYHSNDWKGSVKTYDREANLISIVKIRDGYTTGYKLYLRWIVN